MLLVLKCLGVLVLITFVLIVLCRILFALPEEEGRVDSTVLPPAESGALAEALALRAVGHKGQSGIAPLQNGADSFAARMILAQAAVSSIDVQYYIWHGDLTGYMLLAALQRAAERGVRVRMLLDDNGTAGLDPELAALNAHPNAEVRLYNPFNLRRFKALSYGFDFFRLNRRMHNKSFTVDGLVTILGGRNVGDEYFGTGENALFFDLDVLAVGEIVADVAADFDLYWAAPAVHSAGPIVGAAAAGDPIREGFARFDEDPQRSEYEEILRETNIVTNLLRGTLALEWTQAILISDLPIKGLGTARRRDLLITRLLEAVGNIESRFDGITAYFVPGEQGVSTLAGLEKQGVKVRMLTNSLEATDVVPVHAGYAKRREAMLEAGIELFELRQQAAPRTPTDKLGPFGSSGSSLHAKTFAVDGKRIFIGSFNFDPRSIMLNTEMGLLIDSEPLARHMHRAFDQGLGGLAWRMEMREGKPFWVDPTDGSTIDKEPGSTMLKRAALAVIGWLPVEWLL